jgi:tripartite-type tricarboxylate transporter receptor subunit TctC
VRALALTSATRSPELPEIPTMQEAGFAGVEADTFTALLAPAATPPAIVAKLHDAVAKVLASKATRENFAKQGADVIGSTPQAAGAYIRSEISKWSTVIRAAGLKTEPR